MKKTIEYKENVNFLEVRKEIISVSKSLNEKILKQETNSDSTFAKYQAMVSLYGQNLDLLIKINSWEHNREIQIANIGIEVETNPEEK